MAHPLPRSELRQIVATSLLPSMRQGGGDLPPPFCPSQFAMPAKGVTFRSPPPLPWDGVASSYPTDATICRTGTVFAICDNGAAVHQVASGAADRLRVVQILDVLQLLRVVPTWDNSRAYRVTKCCSAGAQMFLRPFHTRTDVRFLHIPA